MILDRQGIPINSQRLIYGAKQLLNDRTLCDYNIHQENTLHLSLRLVGGMQIHVRLYGDQIITIGYLKPSTRISTVKMMITYKTGIPPCHQRLLFNGQLKDGLPISHYKIDQDSLIDLHHNDETCVKGEMLVYVHVRSSWSPPIKFEVLDSTKVKHIKSLIQGKIGIPLAEQRLIYAGKQLEDGRTLSDYNVRQFCQITLTHRLRMGGQQIRSSVIEL